MGLDGFRNVCNTVKHLINSLSQYKDRVLELVKEGIIMLEDIKYPLYPNSVEIIP